MAGRPLLSQCCLVLWGKGHAPELVSEFYLLISKRVSGLSLVPVCGRLAICVLQVQRASSGTNRLRLLHITASACVTSALSPLVLLSFPRRPELQAPSFVRTSCHLAPAPRTQVFLTSPHIKLRCVIC